VSVAEPIAWRHSLCLQISTLWPQCSAKLESQGNGNFQRGGAFEIPALPANNECEIQMRSDEAINRREKKEHNPPEEEVG